jgi:hypothetical protein
MPDKNPVDPSETVATTPAPLLTPAPTPDPNTQPTTPKPEKDWTDEDPAKDVAKVPKTDANPPAYHNDTLFFRLVIIFAGWVLVLSVGGMLLLAANTKEIPEGVVAVASGLVGLLTGIFAAKSSQT